MNNLKLTEEEIKEMENFAKTNPDDFEYISLLSQGYHGWAELPSGKKIYIQQPLPSGEEVGLALRKVYKRMQHEDKNK